ncbi:MAG: uracil-DNA glycosylase [Myxococcota bacterium]
MHYFVQELTGVAVESCFNPYRDVCPCHDDEASPRRRSRLLSKILDRAEAADVDALWIGRDLGYRGGRRTGLALTDEYHAAEHAGRWGLETEFVLRASVARERTAGAIWSMLRKINSPVFLWNVFPLHPHLPSKPMSNRAHNAFERSLGLKILDELVRLLKPRRIVAIGRDAASAAARLELDIPAYSIRHPSYGGIGDFRRGLSSLYFDSTPALHSTTANDYKQT